MTIGDYVQVVYAPKGKEKYQDCIGVIKSISGYSWQAYKPVTVLFQDGFTVEFDQKEVIKLDESDTVKRIIDENKHKWFKD